MRRPARWPWLRRHFGYPEGFHFIHLINGELRCAWCGDLADHLPRPRSDCPGNPRSTS